MNQAIYRKTLAVGRKFSAAQNSSNNCVLDRDKKVETACEGTYVKGGRTPRFAPR